MVTSGWRADPLVPGRLRHRDRHWTEWVAWPGGEPTRDVEGLRRLRRGRWLRRVGLIAAAVLFAGCGALAVMVIDEAETGGIAEARAEMDRWDLPPSVRSARRPDRQERGLFAASNPSVTRWLAPTPGVAPGAALFDLVAALRAQGYRLTEHSPAPGEPVPTWTGRLDPSVHGRFDLGLDERGRLIEVHVDLDP